MPTIKTAQANIVFSDRPPTTPVIGQKLYYTADTQSWFYFWAQDDKTARAVVAPFWQDGSWTSHDNKPFDLDVVLEAFGGGVPAIRRAAADACMWSEGHSVTITPTEATEEEEGAEAGEEKDVDLCWRFPDELTEAKLSEIAARANILDIYGDAMPSWSFSQGFRVLTIKTQRLPDDRYRYGHLVAKLDEAGARL